MRDAEHKAKEQVFTWPSSHAWSSVMSGNNCQCQVKPLHRRQVTGVSMHRASGAAGHHLRGPEAPSVGKTFGENCDDLHISGAPGMSVTRGTQHRRGGKVSVAAGAALLAGGGGVTNTH